MAPRPGGVETATMVSVVMSGTNGGSASRAGCAAPRHGRQDALCSIERVICHCWSMESMLFTNQ